MITDCSELSSVIQILPDIPPTRKPKTHWTINFRIKGLLLLLFLFFSCKDRNPNCKLYADELLKIYPTKVYIAYRDKGKVLGISDYGKEKTKGGAYYFFPSGMLKYYKFFKADSAYNYDEEYDDLGKLIKTIGQPLVDMDITEVNKDSLVLCYYLFSLHKSFDNAKISINNAFTFDAKIIKDTSYSNMELAFVGINHKRLAHFKVDFSCRCLNECTSQTSNIYDSLSFIKNPRLNLEE